MNKIHVHHRRSLTRTHTAHVVTRALNAEPVCRLCQLIINEINSRVRPGAEKLPVSRQASSPLPVKIREGWARSLYQLFKLYLRPNLRNTLMAIHYVAAEHSGLIKMFMGKT